MNKIGETIRGIKNLGVKILLAVVGLVMIISQVYPFILRGFLLTDHIETWDATEWVLTSLGFFFAVGANYYNTVAEILAKRFGNITAGGKNG